MEKNKFTVACTIFAFLFSYFCFENHVFSQSDDALVKANDFYQQEDYQSAVLLLNKFIKNNSADKKRKTEIVEAYYLLAKIYFEIRDDIKVEEALTEIFKLVPDFSKNESNTAFKKIFDKIKNNPLAKAKEFYLERDFASAIPLLNNFLKENQLKNDEKNNVASAYYLLAKIFYQLRDDPKMNEMLFKLFDLVPDYVCEDNNPGFIKILEEAKKNPLQKANSLYFQGEYKKVISFLEEYLSRADRDHSLQKNIPQVYYLLAKTYFKIKENKKMTDSLNLLMEMAPDFSQEEKEADFKKIFDQITKDPLYLARDYFSRRLLDEALSFLKAFIKQNEKNKNEGQNIAEAYYLLAKIYYQLRDDESMTSALRKTYEINPDFSNDEPNPDFKKRVALLKKELLQDSN